MPGQPTALVQELNVVTVRWRRLSPALNLQAAWAYYITDGHPVCWAWIHGCMNDFTSEGRFDSNVTCIIDVLGLFLACYQWAIVQIGIDRRPVDWCRNYMSVLYMYTFQLYSDTLVCQFCQCSYASNVPYGLHAMTSCTPIPMVSTPFCVLWIAVKYCWFSFSHVITLYLNSCSANYVKFSWYLYKYIFSKCQSTIIEFHLFYYAILCNVS